MKDKCAGSGTMGVLDLPAGTIACPICKQEFSLNRVNTDLIRQHKFKRDPHELTLFEKKRLEAKEIHEEER